MNSSKSSLELEEQEDHVLFQTQIIKKYSFWITLMQNSELATLHNAELKQKQKKSRHQNPPRSPEFLTVFLTRKQQQAVVSPIPNSHSRNS